MSLFGDDNEIVLMHFAVEQGYFKGETIFLDDMPRKKRKSN
jgi:hypothetical protein